HFSSVLTLNSAPDLELGVRSAGQALKFRPAAHKPPPDAAAVSGRSRGMAFRFCWDVLPSSERPTRGALTDRRDRPTRVSCNSPAHFGLCPPSAFVVVKDRAHAAGVVNDRVHGIAEKHMEILVALLGRIAEHQNGDGLGGFPGGESQRPRGGHVIAAR